MSKRIKKVFSSADQVLHLWANQTQDEARCANVFFKGNKCYSYGYHYELGRIESYKGKEIALINANGYSVTTSKHIRYAKAAASHLIVLPYRGRPAFNTVKSYVELSLLAKQEDLLNSFFNHFNRLRFYDYSTVDYNSKYGIGNDITEFNSLCDELGHREYKLNIGQDMVDLYDEHIKVRELKNAALESPEAVAKRERQRAAKYTKQIEDWRLGGSLTEPVRRHPHQLLRVRGDLVETSKGAQVPLADALRLLAAINNGTISRGDKVGDFTFNSFTSSNGVDTDVININCHSILLTEARQVLGIFLNEQGV